VAAEATCSQVGTVRECSSRNCCDITELAMSSYTSNRMLQAYTVGDADTAVLAKGPALVAISSSTFRLRAAHKALRINAPNASATPLTYMQHRQYFEENPDPTAQTAVKQ
jgi:hypothetical protein